MIAAVTPGSSWPNALHARRGGRARAGEADRLREPLITRVLDYEAGPSIEAGVWARSEDGESLGAGAKSRRELRIAYHEAGHAVAAVALGQKVKRVSIVPDEATRRG